MVFPASGTYHVWIGTWGAPVDEPYHLFGTELYSPGFSPTQTHAVNSNTWDQDESLAPNAANNCDIPTDAAAMHEFVVTAANADTWALVDVHADAAEDDLVLVWERPDGTVDCADDTGWDSTGQRDLNPKHVFLTETGTYKAWVVGYTEEHADVGYSIAFSSDKTP
ncbi:MAG: hypothetical protein GY913_20365 [Proteobacteria bacterium]|nr:hypothetical protein [Pseudomonadota bacterium]MCP4919262.1 hypothetical protein [Pseudomonadota bacterium]